MKTRKQIEKKAEKLHAIRRNAKAALVELQKQYYLLCDKEQWFTEKEETVGRGRTKETRLVGRINWKDYFVDDDTGKKIEIERSEIVRINGVWQF